jgi:hypothetical protein
VEQRSIGLPGTIERCSLSNGHADFAAERRPFWDE